MPISDPAVNTWSVTAGTGTSGQSVAVTTVTAGNTIAVGIGSFHRPGIASVTDTLGNVYAQVVAGNSKNTNGRIEIWKCSNCLGGSNVKITVTFAGAPAGFFFGAAEFSGVNTAGTLDGTAVGATGSTTSPAPGTFSTTNANDLVLTAFIDEMGSGTTTISVPTGYTSIGIENNPNSFCSGAFAYKVYAATQSSINPAWSDSGGTNEWGCVSCAIKATVGSLLLLRRKQMVGMC